MSKFNVFRLAVFAAIASKTKMNKFRFAISSLAFAFFVTAPPAAVGGVIFQLSGTVVQADSTAVIPVGNAVSGFVVLTDAAAAFPPAHEFALGNGDVLDVFIQYGPYRWDLSRPSVQLSYFEGFMSPDGKSFSNVSYGLVENFFGIISGAYCPATQVCQLFGGINTTALYDGHGTSVALTTWRRVPEPASLALLALGLLGIGFSRRKKG